jgi:hypothetical protein
MQHNLTKSINLPNLISISSVFTNMYGRPTPQHQSQVCIWSKEQQTLTKSKMYVQIYLLSFRSWFGGEGRHNRRIFFSTSAKLIDFIYFWCSGNVVYKFEFLSTQTNFKIIHPSWYFVSNFLSYQLDIQNLFFSNKFTFWMTITTDNRAHWALRLSQWLVMLYLSDYNQK